MLVGILSMQRVINYGSYLQAYALKKTIEDFGCDVGFVDIKPGKKIISNNNALTKNKFLSKDIFKRIQHVCFWKKRYRLFHKKYFPEIGINTPLSEQKCDLIVIGSDEVFNCCQVSEWGVSLQLFGDTECPSISYAASAGFATIEMINKLGIKNELNEALNKMRNISVRDNNTYDIVQGMGLKCQKNVDPVLVYDWNKSINKVKRIYKNYILVYGYDNRINDSKEISIIKKFAKEKNKKLISFGVYQRWCDKNIICSPLELISYFDMADYVITDTFHGTVISIKRNKQFVTIIRDSNKNKIMDLLSTFNLVERSLDNIDLLNDLMMTPINYNSINNIITKESDSSLKYLRDSIFEC